MMDKYLAFRSMMDFLADHAEVVDADMNWLGNTIKVIGENEKQIIEIEVIIKEKEEQNNGN